jgi:protein-tyrosine-phosphatase
LCQEPPLAFRAVYNVAEAVGVSADDQHGYDDGGPVTQIRSKRKPDWVLTAAILLVCSAGARLGVATAAGPVQAAATTATRRTTVLFLCPHGAAKSVLASAYFQRVAKERGLNVRVEAAGIEPQEAVSPVVADHLRRNGYTVPVTKPRAVTADDLAGVDVVISMGCDLTSLPVKLSTLQRWDEVPGPSEDFKVRTTRSVAGSSRSSKNCLPAIGSSANFRNGRSQEAVDCFPTSPWFLWSDDHRGAVSMERGGRSFRS